MLNDLIGDIIITRESLGVTRQQFSTILILGNSKNNDETIKEYKSLREVLVDYPPSAQGASTEEYKCASKIFLQQPSASRIFICQKKSAESWVQLHTRFINSGKYAYCVIVAPTATVADIIDDELKALAVATEANKQVFAVNIIPGKEIVLAKYNNINYYDYVSNETNPRVGVNCGKVANGNAFEISYFEDWVITTIKENLLNVFLSKPIVPYNAFGFSLVSGAIMQALIEAANRGVIERVISSDVEMPKLNNISEQDRASGILNGISFRFTLSYAIKKIGTIYGIVTALNA